VLVDNGRSERLHSEDFKSALKCIRCGACMNTCPVYRRSGGHSYHYAIAGPIGSILAPGLDMKKYADLPFASTLCGSCTNVCPVKIDIHDQLYKWRQVIVKNGYASHAKATGLKGMAFLFAHPRLYRWAGTLGRLAMNYMPAIVNNKFNPWYKQREMPRPPEKSFGEWYKANRRNGR
jgi:L-lactate dehydrogenase complex protein LldF